MRHFTFFFLIILFTSFFSSSLYAWDAAAAKYYPLSIGNVWVYNKYAFVNGQNQFLGTTHHRITGTQVQNGHLYYRFDYFLGMCGNTNNLERIDSSTMNVYYIDPISGQEKLLDSLFAVKNDTFYGKRNCNTPIPVLCSDTNRANVFGLLCKQRFFTADGLIFCQYSLIENFGFGGYLCWEGNSWSCGLKGCVINGVVYGDTTRVVVSVPSPAEVPLNFRLYQNYPNPFNPTTEIKFDLSSPDLVILKVYDISGSEIDVLVNEYKNEGTHYTKFDGSNLPSGLYIYKITIGKFTDSKKMVLLK